MGKIAFVFPGQGSQNVGMGKDLFESCPKAEKMFRSADSRLGFPLSDLIFNGPEEKLKRTENTQPALFTVSAILYRLLSEKGVKADYVAGHSLGEYSALYAAGVFSFSDGVYAVRQRGLLMEQAVPAGEGTMAAVLGLDPGTLDRICIQVTQKGSSVQMANLNAPGQIVISGTLAGVQTASRLAEQAGARRVVPLAVSGPFHSALMRPAADAFRRVLDGLTAGNADIPVVANSTAELEESKEDIIRNLVKQLYSPVRWVESIEKLRSLNVDTYIEIGPGRVLSGLIRKIHRGCTLLQVNDLKSLDKVAEKLKECV